MKILIIGGGNMGLTYAKSFLHSRICTSEQLLILEKSNEKADALKKLNIGTVYGEPGDYVKDADLIVLAVKPQDVHLLFEAIKPYIDTEQVVLSIMAGIPLKSISEGIGVTKVVRAMPNLPAQIGKGMTVFTSSDMVTRIELVMVQNLLNATGKAIYIDDENMIDAATAVSGSGPAYVFYFMQVMVETAKQMGFDQSQAELLSYQTFAGAVDLLNKHNFSCEEWMKMVASRGGTTEAALNSFNDGEVSNDINKGIFAAYNRARELSKLV